MNRLTKAILLILGAYLFLKVGIPFAGSIIHHGSWPVVPTSVLKMYMFFVIAGVILAFTFDEEGYNEIFGPILDIYADEGKKNMFMGLVGVVSVLGAFVTYQNIKPTFDPPVELRSIHPAPPASTKMWGKSFNLQTLENPLRADKENFAKNLEEGGRVYYQNCYFCHGDYMNGKGPFYAGFNPMPANFVDVGTIAQLTESFVFWRIGTGGPGLPSEGAPWISAMPVWHNLLTEEELWQVIMFLYEYTGHSPRVTTKVQH